MADDKTYTAEQYEALKADLKAAKESASVLREELTAAKAQAAAAVKEATGLKAQAEGVPGLQEQIATLRADLARSQAQGAANTAMLEAGVSDGSVRDYMLHLHGKHAAEAGDKAQPFADWFKAQTTGESVPAVLAPFLKPAAPADGKPAAPLPLRTETGAKPAPVPPAPHAPGTVASMSREDFKAQRAQLVAEAQRGLAGIAALGG